MSTRYSVEEARQLPFFGERFVFPKNVGMGIVSPGEKGAIIEIDKQPPYMFILMLLTARKQHLRFLLKDLLPKLQLE